MKGDKFHKTRNSLTSRTKFTLSQKVVGGIGIIVIIWLFFSFSFLFRDIEDNNPNTINTTKKTINTDRNTSKQASIGLQKFSPKTTIEKNFDWLQRSKWVFENNKKYLEQAYKGEGEVTLVSGMFDLGRGDLDNSFKRPFTHYIERFRTFLEYKFPKVIFIQKEHLEFYQPFIDANPYPTYVILKSIDDIRSFKYFNEIQKIRTNKKWSNQESWLSESPQATMELYNPMVMSKLLWTIEVANLNPFNTPYFLWIDGGHLCNDPKGLDQSKISFFTEKFDKLLITFFDYQPYREIHGFEKEGFYSFIGNRDNVVRVGRGGVFGGTKEYMEVAAEIYLEAIGATLSAGYMGTEENIFSILYYRFPELVHDFENGEGGNCAIFNDAVFGPPIVVDFHVDGFDLRGLTCIKEKNGEINCYNKGTTRKCPSYVTPKFLSEADDQWICTPNAMEKHKYFCTVECTQEGEVKWFAHSCDSIRQGPCPPYSKVPYKEFYDDDNDPFDNNNNNNDDDDDDDDNNNNDNNNNDNLEDYYNYNNIKVNNNNKNDNNNNIKLIDNIDESLIKLNNDIIKKYIENNKNNDNNNEKKKNTNFDEEKKLVIKYDDEFSREMKKKLPNVDKSFIVNTMGGFNLRGLKCEIEVDHKNRKKEVCFLEYRSGRDRCPDYVTSAYLTLAPTQWTCHHVDGYYCTAMCQEGTDKVAWSAHDKEWCSSTGDCPDEPEIIPFDDFHLSRWSLPPPPLKTCDHLNIDQFLGNFPKITVGALARGSEILSLSLSLKTWEERGFIQFVDEFIIYINERNDEMDKLLLPYTKPPYNIKVIGNEINYGIIRAINYLVTNSTNDYFLFLEKDFRLVESLQCALDQLSAGIDLLDHNVAHVVKYRSRYNAGRPNWAEALYRDKEETVFSNQPNLLCNFYHWIDHPEKLWPDLFHICNDEPLFYCVVGRFCNWTNNPFLIHKMWWIKEYMEKYDQIANSAFNFDLETWMNWDANAWDNRNWVIAEGDGLFKHCDANNFGF